MEKYQRVFSNIFIDGKYDISFSIGSRIRDGQYIILGVNDCYYSINVGYMDYFSFTPINSNRDLINQRSPTLLTLGNGCYSVVESQIISDLVYRSCEVISESKLQHYVIIFEKAILDIVVSQEIVITERKLDLQIEYNIFKVQDSTFCDKIPIDNYYFFAQYSTSDNKQSFYILGSNRGIKIKLDSVFAFYMIEEGVDLTRSPENIEYTYLPIDSAEQYLYSIKSRTMENQPTYCLHNLLDYNVYFYSENIPKLFSFSF